MRVREGGLKDVLALVVCEADGLAVMVVLREEGENGLALGEGDDDVLADAGDCEALAVALGLKLLVAVGGVCDLVERLMDWSVGVQELVDVGEREGEREGRVRDGECPETEGEEAVGVPLAVMLTV